MSQNNGIEPLFCSNKSTFFLKKFDILWWLSVCLITWHRILVISIQSSKLLLGTDALSDSHNIFDEH